MSVKKIKILKEKVKKIKIQINIFCKIKKNQSIKKSFDQLDQLEKLHNKLYLLTDEIHELQQKLKPVRSSSKKGSRKRSKKGSRKRSKKRCSTKRSMNRKLSYKHLLNCYCSK